jgi:hypothetical protein
MAAAPWGSHRAVADCAGCAIFASTGVREHFGEAGIALLICPSKVETPPIATAAPIRVGRTKGANERTRSRGRTGWAAASNQLNSLQMTGREAGLKIEGVKHSNLETGASHDLHQGRSR